MRQIQFGKRSPLEITIVDNAAFPRYVQVTKSPPGLRYDVIVVDSTGTTVLRYPPVVADEFGRAAIDISGVPIGQGYQLRLANQQRKFFERVNC